MAKTGSKVKERERLQKAQEVRGKTTSVVIAVTFLWLFLFVVFDFRR